MSVISRIISYKKNLWVLLIGILLLTACGDNSSSAGENIADVEAYEKISQEIDLQAGFQPYLVSYSQNAFCYVTQENKKVGDEIEAEHHIVFQRYSEELNDPVVTIENGIIKDISICIVDDIVEIMLLWTNDDESHILGYSEAGALLYDVLIDSRINLQENYSLISKVADYRFALYNGNDIYEIGKEGKIASSFSINGYVSKLLNKAKEKLFVVYSDSQSENSLTYIAEIDFDNERLENITSVPGGNTVVTSFDETRFATWTEDFISLFAVGEEDLSPIVDLEKQSIVSSEIQYVTDTEEGIEIVSLDMVSDAKMYRFLLCDKDNSDVAGSEADVEKEREYTKDGRPVIHVAVPTGYIWQIEYWCKKFNQISADSFIQIDRFDGNLEDYLGKGNRPDAVMLTDHTEIEEYANKGILADMFPMFEQHQTYSINEIVPRVVDLLSVDGELYGMSGRFSLLLRSSTGEEFDASGACTPVEYFCWYDEYLGEKNIQGMGNLESIIYANLPYFYDEAECTPRFSGEEFKELMKAYKEVLSRSRQEKTSHLISDYGYTTYDIFDGPKWYESLSNMTWFGEPENAITGMPYMDGTSVELMNVAHPICIMEYSEFKAGAFDFVMYYSSQAEYIVNGNATTDVGKSYTSCAPFSTFRDVLRAEIFETEKPFAVAGSTSGEVVDLYFSDEMLSRIEYLIDNAVTETKTQKVVFTFLKEDMEDYFNDNKYLEEACEVLESRVLLYLMENH